MYRVLRKSLAALALAASCALPAAADQIAGVSGTVINLDSGKSLPNAAVAIYRLPMHDGDAPVASSLTDRHGFFSNITLDPGRYLITANVMGMRSSCELEEIEHGVVARVRIELSLTGERCVGKHLHSAIVVPGQTSDVYIIH